jgi:glycosyltransferase involved in cell wall biosynthesis
VPRFTLLTPTRDRPEWLPRCIESALAQTFTDFEQIVYDNGEQSVRHLIPDDPRIRYVRGQAAGPASAFQNCLDRATGDIIHPFSDDDELVPHALEVVDREIGDYEWLHALTEFTGDRGTMTLGGPLDVERLKSDYYLGGAIYWRRSLTDRLRGFDLGFDGAADYELYLRFALNAPARFVDEVLYLYTDHPGTDSRVRTGNQMSQTNRIRTAA